MASIEGYEILPENCDEATLMSYLLEKGPLAVSVDASAWSAYSGGVLTYDECGATIDHAVMLVGFGTDRSYGDCEIPPSCPPSSNIHLTPAPDPPPCNIAAL